MSTLNLTPNPVVILTQAAVFFVHIAIVKRLILDPYLQMINRRRAATAGKNQQAKQLEAEIAVAEAEISKRLDVCRKECGVLIEAEKKAAEDHRNKSLFEAQREAREYVGSQKRDIAEQLDREQGRIANSSGELVRDVFAAVTR